MTFGYLKFGVYDTAVFSDGCEISCTYHGAITTGMRGVKTEKSILDYDAASVFAEDVA